MKDYKVGDRVWWTTYKILCEVADIKYSENGTPFEWIIDTPGFKGIRFDLFRIKEITQSADSMFEELGYEKTQPLAHLVRYTHLIDGYIININFNLSKQVYYCDNKNGVACGILKDEHQAIHQKLIELGWIE